MGEGVSRRWFLTLALMVTAGPALADDDRGDEGDDEDERAALAEAVTAGRVRPLSEIRRLLADKLPGEILSVEVEEDDGVWSYEFKTIAADGLRVDVYVDGTTGAILKTVRR